jgi:hypothetical protein
MEIGSEPPGCINSEGSRGEVEVEAEAELESDWRIGSTRGAGLNCDSW